MNTHSTLIGGVPVVWVDSPLPFVANIVVRMGQVDETLPTHGMSHLLEHMVLGTDWPVEDFNATVMPVLTHFWFSGEPRDALARLTSTLSAMANPPPARLARERDILRTEAYGRGQSQVALHAALRYGPRGIGVADYPELGLQRATHADVLAWAQRFFVTGNTVIALTQAPPDEFTIALPEGPSVTAPHTEPIDEIVFPSSFVSGPPGLAGISMIVRRSYEIVTAMDIATHRLRQWLRHEEGVSYHVGSAYDPISKEEAHLVIWADCRPHSAQLVRNALLSVVDDLAFDGPTQADLERSFDSFKRLQAHPASAYDRVMYDAAQRLLGDRTESVEEMVAARAQVTASAVQEAVAQGFKTLIVTAPGDAPQLGGRFEPYPVSAPRIEGKRYKPTAEERPEELVIGTEAVAIEGDSCRSVRFDRIAAALLWDDGSVGVYGDDGFYVLVDPAEWQNGPEAARALRGSLGDAVTIDMSSDPPTFEDVDLRAGSIAYEAQEWESAVACLEAGLLREPDSAAAWVLLAWAAHKAGMKQRAIEAARQAMRLDPHDAWSAEFLAARLVDAGNYVEAAAAARAALRRSPTRLTTLSGSADALSKAGHHAEAMRIGRRAAELFPETASAWFAYGWSARFASEWSIAEDALRRCVQLAPDEAMWHNNLGVLLLDVGRYAEALREFERTLELDPANRFAPNNIPGALHRLGRTDEAASRITQRRAERLEEAERELAVAPNDPFALEKLARVLHGAERDDEAAEVVRRALDVEPTPARFVLLAQSLIWLGEPEEARRALDQALELDANHLGALDELAWLAAMQGDSAAAVDAAARIEAGEGARRALWARGCAATVSGDLPTAALIFDELVTLRPGSCCAIALLGLVRLEEGDAEAARAEASRVRELTPWRCASLKHLERRLAAA